MPRETQRRKTRREQVSLRADNAPQLQPSRRPLGAIANSSDKNVRAARALERAFNIGTEFAGDVIARRAEKFSLAGQRAAAEGREPTPEELKQDAFMRGYNAITTDRELVELEGQAVELYSTLDVRNLTSEQVASKLDELFQSQYEGVDTDDELDRDKLERVLPRWNATVEKVLQQHQQDNAAAVEQDVQSSVAIAIDHEVRTTGTIDLETRNRQFFQIYGPQNANAELVNTVTAYAIDAGRPELIEELQATKKWASNAPAPGGISDYNTVLANAKVQAKARQRERAAAEESAEKEAQEAWQSAQEADLVQTILQGGSTRQRIASLLDEGFDPAKARVLVNFERSVRDDVEGAEVDWNAVTSFQTELYADGFNTANGLSQITALAEAGQLGSGQARQQLVNQFVTRLGQVESARERDPKFRGLLNQLSAEYSGSSIMERLDPRYKQRRAKAEGLFTELVAVQGIDAQAAYDQVTGDNGIPKLTADNAGSGLSAVLPLVLQGRTDASALIEFKPAGVSLADYIEALESEHGITFTTDQLKQLNGAR